MIVTCPQCQSENQVEAAAAGRIPCRRCATMIPLPTATFQTGSPLLELDSPSVPRNGHTEASSPLDLDSLFAPPISVPPPPRAQSWEFDEVLDIPKAAPQVPPSDAALEIEEILSVSARPALTTQETSSAPTTEIRNDVLSPLQDVNAGQSGESKLGPWAKPPEAKSSTARLPEPHQAARPSVAFPQDSFQFNENTVVMTPPRRAKSGLAKVFVALAVFVALGGVAYYFLSPLVREWLSEPAGERAAKPTATTTASNAGKPTTVPSAAPAAAAKPSAEVKPSPAAIASGVQPAAAQTPKLANSSVSPSPTTAAKPAPQPIVQAPSKPQPGGHLVGQSEGSLTVQVGAYNDLSQANERAAKLKAAGIEARVVKAQIPQKGTWYRVQVGRFTSQAEADRYRNELRAKGAAKESIVTGYQVQ